VLLAYLLILKCCAVQNVIRADFVWYEQRTNEMFFLMELVDGGDLQTWMIDERMYAGSVNEQQTRLLSVAHQLSCAVRHLHQRGILHQDIKPDNVLMTMSGTPVLADLGVGSEGIFEGEAVKATLRGGTPVYASPRVRRMFFKAKSLPVVERMEFLEANPITHLDDFFAMGATIFDTFADCGWRRGRSVAEVFASSSVSEIVGNTNQMRLRVAIPESMAQVLEVCFDESTAGVTIRSIAEQIATTFPACRVPPEQEGLNGKKCANIRSNLGIALYDSGRLGAAHTQFERAHNTDNTLNMRARTLNNLGAVNLKLGKSDEAMRYFEEVLKVVPDHMAATFNKGLAQTCNKEAEVKLDRTGAADMVEDGRGKVDLANAVRFLYLGSS
jgi:serine/threonine protein kinase